MTIFLAISFHIFLDLGLVKPPNTPVEVLTGGVNESCLVLKSLSLIKPFVKGRFEGRGLLFGDDG